MNGTSPKVSRALIPGLFLGIGILGGMSIPRTPQGLPVEGRDEASIAVQTIVTDAPHVSPDDFNLAMKSVSEHLALGSMPRTMLDDFGRIAEREGFPESIAKVRSSLESRDLKDQLYSAIFRRWSEVSPESAAGALDSLPLDSRYIAENIVVKSWVEKDPNGALAWIQQAPERGVAYDTLIYVLQKFAASDPQTAIRLQGELPFAAAPNRRYWCETIVRAWAVHDTEGALAYAMQLDEREQERRSVAVREAVTRWATKDFDAAWNWGMNVADPDDRQLVAKSLLNALADADPRGAISKIQTLPPGKDRDEVLGVMIGGLAAQDPEESLRLVEQLAGDDSKPGLFKSVLQEWLKTDPESAFRTALDSMPLGEQRTGILSSVINKTASRDFDETLALVERVEPDGTREQMRVTAALALLRSFPEKALEWAESFPPGKSRERIFSEITQYHAHDDPEGMVELALREGRWNGDSHTLLEPVLEKWGYRSPKEAADWIVGHTDSAFAEKMAPTVVNNWMRHGNDTKGAKRWVADLPEGELRSRAMEKIAGVLAATDSEAATSWLETLPKGQGRDRAIRNFALVTLGVDPPAAMQWAGAIGEESRRENSLRAFAKKWSETDRAAATSWLRGRNFSEAWIEEVFSGVNTR